MLWLMSKHCLPEDDKYDDVVHRFFLVRGVLLMVGRLGGGGLVGRRIDNILIGEGLGSGG